VVGRVLRETVKHDGVADTTPQLAVALFAHEIVQANVGKTREIRDQRFVRGAER